MTTALEVGEGSVSRPGRSIPLENTRYPLYRRLGGSQGRSGQVRKISPPPGFDPRTVQPVASRCSNYATPPTQCTIPYKNPRVTSNDTDMTKRNEIVLIPHLYITEALFKSRYL